MMSKATLVCALLLIAGIRASLTLEIVTVQNCTCDSCPAKHSTSGKCSADPLNAANGRLITCMDQVQQCAQLINFNDAACTVFSGVFTAVCGTCQKLNANPPYYARANCDPVSNQVNWDTNCNVGCTQCLSKDTFVHPFSVCSPGLGGNGYTYNQGISSCDAVNVTVLQSTTCATGAVMLDQFVVGQYSCNFGEFMSCTPKNPAILPPTGTAIVKSNCPWGMGGNIAVCASCPQYYFPADACHAPPPNLQDKSVHSVRATCQQAPAYCGDLIIHGNTQCSMFVGRTTPVCGSCMMLGATDGPAGTYSNISCNMTSQAITISHGCNADCSVCTMPNYITHPYTQCSVGDPNGTSTYNRGIFPCNVVSYNHYTDSSCQVLYHVEKEADGECQFDRMSQCVDRVVTFQNCSNPADSVTTMENVCVPDPVVDTNFRIYNCNNQAPTCSEVVEYSDPGCTQMVDAMSMVCNQCMKVIDRTNPSVETYQSITCNATDQSVTIKTSCDATCTNCLNPNVITHHVGACSVSPSGHFLRNEGLSTCDAVNIQVYTTSNCNASSLQANFTISQDVCTFHEFVQCSADPLPTPPMGNELVYEQCMDPHCGYGCLEVVDTLSGGCIPNYQGRPGAHVVSCDARDSWCADLSIHSGATCGPFIGTFHPVCGSCSPWFNDSDPYGFYLVTCDSANPNVTISGGCDPQCQNCQQPNMHSNPYLQCSGDLLSHDRSILNRGVVPCATVSIIEYSDVSCMGSTMIASWQASRDFCDIGHHTTCAAATIGIQNCTACNGGNNAGCNKTMISENACVADPHSTILGGTRTVSCVPQWQQCVHLAMFGSGTCAQTTYRTSAQAVCNQCNQLIEVDAQGNPNIVFAKLTCNPAYNWVSIQTHCNNDCTLCNETDTTLIYDQCTETTFLGGVYNFGLENCDAVQINQYHDRNCSGTNFGSYMVGQHQCSFDEYFECSARPMLETIPFNGKVVQRTCGTAGDVACVDCTTQVFASASCQIAPFKFGAKNHFGSYTITCSSFDFQATCANFAIHNDSQCTTFAGDHHPVCNSCVQLPGETNFTQVLCNVNTQAVTFNKDCNPQCTQCGSTITHNLMTCDQITNASPKLNGKYLYNRGLMPCDTVLVEQFNSLNCDPSTIAAAWPQATSACEFGGSIQCVPHTVHIQQCANPTAAETVVVEGQCVADPFGMFRQYRCFDESLTCATMIMYNTSSTCNPALDNNGAAHPQIIAGVCGSCQKRPSMANPNVLEYFLMNCDPNKQTVWFDGGCNANCQRCTQPRMETHPFMQCSQGYIASTSIFNQGVRPCSGVQVSVFPDNTCTGSSQSWFEAGQRDCGEFDHLYIYCDANPNMLPPDGGQVLFTRCPWQQGENAMKRAVEGDCTSGCMTFPIVDGACAPAPPGETRFVSHRLSCDTQRVGMCADIVLFNSTSTCTPATFMGLHTPVCDSCFLFGNDVTYTKAQCNFQREEISFLTGCNADCSQCTTNNTIGKLQCDPTVRPGFSMVMRGLFQCPTVTFTHYSSTDCLPGTSIGTFIAAQGVCQFDQRLQCSKNLVTIQNCSCPTCAATYTSENQCTADAFGAYRKYGCANTAVQCVNMGFFGNDAQCQGYTGGYSVVCNSCSKQQDPFTGESVYVAIICNETSQEVMSLTGCSDSSCSDCSGSTFVHPFNQCSRFMRGSSVFNSGLQPCASMDITVYSDSLCSTQSVDHWQQGQDFCVMQEYISCSAAPVVNPSSTTPNNALEFYTCPVGTGLDYGCIGCTVSTEVAGSCYPSDHPGHYRSTSCDSHMAFCASFVIHNDSTCQGNYLGDHNPVCGSCSRWFNNADYTHVQCDVFSHNITVSFQCNSDCSVCGSNVTHPFMQCTQLFDNPAWHLYNRGVQPCSTVSITEFSDSSCSSVVNTFQVAQDLCQYGHKVKCFYEGEPLAPAASPDTGLSAGAAAGVTFLVVAVVVGAAFGAYKYRQRKVYRSVDPQWSAMNETSTPSNVQGSYGSLQAAEPSA